MTSQSFEQSMDRLQKIVEQMENGEVGLDESLKLFAEGAELIGGCREVLQEAQLAVEKLFPEDKNND